VEVHRRHCSSGVEELGVIGVEVLVTVVVGEGVLVTVVVGEAVLVTAVGGAGVMMTMLTFVGP